MPSSEPLSTTIVCRSDGNSANSASDLRQFITSAWQFQVTIIIESILLLVRQVRLFRRLLRAPIIIRRIVPSYFKSRFRPVSGQA